MTGWYDHYSDESADGCFALSLMRSEKGASAVIAASRISWSGYNDCLAEGLVKAVWDDFGLRFLPHAEVKVERRIGTVLKEAKAHLLNSYIYWKNERTKADEFSEMTAELFNLFGDPEMRVLPAQ
jgi:hypothetical protein